MSRLLYHPKQLEYTVSYSLRTCLRFDTGIKRIPLLGTKPNEPLKSRAGGEYIRRQAIDTVHSKANIRSHHIGVGKGSQDER